MFRNAFLALFVALPMVATTASAATITFDGTGSGGGVQIDQINASPGNTITIGGGAVGSSGGGANAGAAVTTLYQANLDSANNTATPGNEYSNGNFGRFYTIVAGIPETVSGLSTPASVRFNFDAARAVAAPSADNYFYIYSTTLGADVTGNDLSGHCFTCGTLILQGVFTGTNFTNAFNPAVQQDNPALDGHNADNYLGTTTLEGVGSLKAQIMITSFNAAFFPGLQTGVLFQWTADTFTNLAYSQTDPSACFNRDGLGAVASCVGEYGAAGTANIGATNGESGPDIMLENHATFSFPGVTAVPEPATMTLVGLSLLGSAAARRRQKNKK